jgi:predicted methyltransferase
MIWTVRRFFSVLVYAALVPVASDCVAQSPDVYDAAVQHPGRKAGDLARDATDHPAEVLRLAGIQPGMSVADVLAGEGYYSELLSNIVGPGGHVLLVNNAWTDDFIKDSWRLRLARKRLPNVEHRRANLEKLDIPEGSLDALLLIKVYHDLYWVDPAGQWPKMSPAKVLDQLARVLKPGGVLLLVDHSAQPGTGSADASPLHRIDEAYARREFESHGFQLVAKSDVLRRPEDGRDQLSYQPPMLGKTDRFVMVFRKNAG